jgi:L-ascorbate metabolism protein UlaG (beta-lactamase superfamily)
MDIQIVLLTHEHFSDHLNMATLERMQFERPSLRIGAPAHMLKHVNHLRNIDVFEVGKWYDYGEFDLSTIKLYHDVENVGYRIFKDSHKTIHCTDTGHLIGIQAKDYDLFALEHNYSEETVHESIAAIEARGQFAYQKGAINTHLSSEQAQEFFFKNKGENSEVIRLHESSSNK